MNAEKVLKELYRLLQPTGGVLIVGSVPTSQNRQSAAKDELIKRLVVEYLGPDRRAGKTTYNPAGQSWEHDLLPNSPFGNFIKRKYTINFVQNIDQVVGELYSKSWAIRSHFGIQINNFEHQIREQLANIAAGQKFVSNIKFEAFFLKK